MKIGYLMQAGVPDLRRHPLSGPANHVKNVFVELQSLGHDLRLVALHDNQVWKSDDLETFSPVPVRIDRGTLRLFERGLRRIQHELQLPYAAFFESVRFALACRQELAGCDVFYERMGWFGYGGAVAARWLRVPWILEVNGDHLRELAMRGMAPRGAQRWVALTLMKTALRTTSHVVAAGEGLRRTFIERWGAPPESVTVVDNGSELVSLLDRGQLRSFDSQRAPHGPTTLVYLSGFEPWQGATTLIRAVAAGIARGASLEVLLIGSGPAREEAEQLARERRIDEGVHFVDRLTPAQYATVLAQADIGVSPYSHWIEYQGLKLMDYKAAGLAIVASGEGGQPRTIDHGRTGWIVPPGDENALSEAVIRLASDHELRRRMGRAARLEAEQLHDWRTTAKRLEELFDRVVHEAPRHRAFSKGRHVLNIA